MEILNIEIKRQTAVIKLENGETIVCRRDDVAALGLAPGTEQKNLRSRLCRHQLDEGYDAALSLLDYSAKTRQELTKKLQAKGYLDEVIEAVADRLTENRLLDDKYIAERLVQGAGSRGIYAIKQKLRQKGISEEDADAALSEISDEEQAEAAYNEAVRLSRRYAGLEPRAYKAKLSQALARRGFTWDSIESALARLNSEDDFDI